MKLTKNMAILRPETYEKNNQDIERNNTTLPLKIKSNEEEVMETHSEGNALRTQSEERNFEERFLDRDIEENRRGTLMLHSVV